VLNLYVPANRLHIIQKVPTPTSFDLSTAADMLLRSSYINKRYSEKNTWLLSTLLFLYSSNKIRWFHPDPMNRSQFRAGMELTILSILQSISSMYLCSDFRILEQLLISKMTPLLIILPLYYFTRELWTTIFTHDDCCMHSIWFVNRSCAYFR